MSALIDDLLKFGQLTHQRVDMSTISVKSFCEEVVAQMKDQIAAANATVRMEVADESAQGNAFLLNQALTNPRTV
jgi:signal transduction histidine kinase